MVGFGKTPACHTVTDMVHSGPDSIKALLFQNS